MLSRNKFLTFSLSSLLCLCILVGVTNTAAAACPASLPADKGSTTATINAATSGTYYIWSRNRTTSSSSNGYYLQIDNSSSKCFTVGDAAIPTNTWTWVNYQNGSTSSRMSTSLSAGSHSFKLAGLDAGLQVDRLIFTTDSACTPTGSGDNCANSTTDPPPIVISNPGTSGPSNTYNGTITVGSGSGKTIVKVDGQPIASGNGQVSVDTTQLSDGYHTLAIESFDANGNKTVTYRKILVQNHHNFYSRFYHSLYMGLGENSLLAITVIVLMALTLLALIALALYEAWYWKVWEKIPLINRIHLKFLHVPAFMYRIGAKLPSLKFPFMKSPAHSITAGGVVVGGSHVTHAGTIQGNVFQRLFNRPGARWFVVLGFALVGTMTALYSLAATTAFVIEPEGGSISVATRINDGSASGGAYLLFGTGSCPAGQTGTPPNCTTPQCPAGQTGTPPNCVTPPTTGNVGPANCQLTQADEPCWAARTGVLKLSTADQNDRWTQAEIRSGAADGQLTRLTGCQVISTGGSDAAHPYIYENKRINGVLAIRASNVVVRNVYVEYQDSGWCQGGQPGNGSGCCSAIMTGNDDAGPNIKNVAIQDSEVEAGYYSADSGLVGVGMNIQRVNAHGGFIIAGYNDRSYMQDVYFHDVTREDECVYNLTQDGQSCVSHTGVTRVRGTPAGYLHKDTLWEQNGSDFAIVHSYMKHSSFTNPIGGSSGGCLCNEGGYGPLRNVYLKDMFMWGGSNYGIMASGNNSKVVWDNLVLGGQAGAFAYGPKTYSDYTTSAWAPTWNTSSPGPGSPGIPNITGSHCSNLKNMSGAAIPC